ncbi:MAG: YicC/YloC family endoribonuclease [Maricaulaceae bacterium]
MSAKPRLSGMTGFARAEGSRGAVSWVWEVKSVNGRGLDLRARTPPGFDGLEPPAREAVKSRFKRGSFQLNLQVRREETEARAQVDLDQLKAVIEASRSVIEPGVVEPARLDGLLALRGVLKTDDSSVDAEEEERLSTEILISLNDALGALEQARRDEGAALSSILSVIVDDIERLAGEATRLAAAQPSAIHERLRERLAELLEGDLPEERLATEAALLAVKADVREELDRLAAHVVTARNLLAGAEPAGRKLDFLAQEFNREANTLCSKSSDGELTRIGLDLKAAIDQFREQAQNVE